MGWNEAIRLLLPAAQALAFAHQRGVIHGHLRPTTILLREGGIPVLFDFGVEQVITRAVLRDVPGGWLGSEISCCTSPEQAFGALPGCCADPRSDIYSFGMILFDLLAGRRAFESETPLAELVQQYSQPLPDLNRLFEHFPEVARIILAKALAVDPSQRFQDMQHFTLLLAKMALNQPVSPALVRDANCRPRGPWRWQVRAGVFLTDPDPVRDRWLFHPTAEPGNARFQAAIAA
jgi:eukaryotic-like serine/threonine-protein kinase